MADSIRLNKYLAHQTGISRREADQLISQGKVTINSVAAELGARINDEDQIAVSGKPIAANTPKRYIIFHKPTGYVCSRRAQANAPTIYSLLPDNFRELKPVGRLDKDSSGLLLLTNDGDFAHRQTHPSFHKQKIYYVTLDEDLQPLHQQMINQHQIKVDDWPSRITLDRQDEQNRRDWKVAMSEGRNRQIRRTFEALGYSVVSLHRTNFGNYSLGDIQVGDFQALDISNKV